MNYLKKNNFLDPDIYNFPYNEVTKRIFVVHSLSSSGRVRRRRIYFQTEGEEPDRRSVESEGQSRSSTTEDEPASAGRCEEDVCGEGPGSSCGETSEAIGESIVVSYRFGNFTLFFFHMSHKIVIDLVSTQHSTDDRVSGVHDIVQNSFVHFLCLYLRFCLHYCFPFNKCLIAFDLP